MDERKPGSVWTERQQHSIDLAARCSFGTRVLLCMFGRRLNREVFSPVVNRAYQRGVINSKAMHDLCADFDPTQPGTVGLASGYRPLA